MGVVFPIVRALLMGARFLTPILLLSATAAIGFGQIPDIERKALIALYDATDGPNWVDNDGWLGAAGTECDWYGVNCDNSDQNVLQLLLGLNGLSGVVPAELGDLQSVFELRLSGNQLTGLAPEFGGLPSLRTLRLQNNQITSLPPGFGGLSSIQTLYLGNNQLTSLPPEFGGLSALRTLYLQNNQLTSLPPDFGGLSALRTLYLQNNQLTSLPPDFGGLPLYYLYLEDNQLTSLPPQFGNLPNLYELHLEDNQLTSLPSEFGDLSSLQKLYLENNQLTSLPPEFGDLLSLRYLYLENNRITSLPPEFWDLESLGILDLGNNQLTSLPPEFGDLLSLGGLFLEDNHLTSLPQSIGNISGLRSLYLGDNHLTSLPQSIGNISGLRDLTLQGNRLLSLPLELTDTAVTYLDVRWNAIDTVEPELRALLDSLQPTWLSTQTVAPLAVDFTRVSDTTAWVTWWPIEYTFDPGGYEVLIRTFPDGEWQSAGWTESKYITSFPATGLDPGVPYDVHVRSFTYPHPFNEHYLTSQPSWVITATTSSWGCIPPVISTQGRQPTTLSVPAGSWSYLWSTGETMDQITVSPERDTWYWVTTVDGSCEETSSVLVIGSRIFVDGFESGDTSVWSETVQ